MNVIAACKQSIHYPNGHSSLTCIKILTRDYSVSLYEFDNYFTRNLGIYWYLVCDNYSGVEISCVNCFSVCQFQIFIYFRLKLSLFMNELSDFLQRCLSEFPIVRFPLVDRTKSGKFSIDQVSIVTFDCLASGFSPVIELWFSIQ